MNEKDSIDLIFRKRDSKCKLGLERVKILLDYMGNPQNKLKFIHVAGTNGKGSITTTLSNILIDSGYKVGKYISPYVDNFYERIQINNEYIEENNIKSILDKIVPFIETMDDAPTPFEIIAAIAFEYFCINKCDIVCLEVGMGGRFDATNCIENTIISIITVIDYDHMDFLGNTIEEIAFEKCGIIKENKITVTYPLQAEKAYKMIKSMADIRKNKLIDIDLDNLIDIKKINFNYQFTYKKRKYILGLNGKHQIYNTLVVIETIEQLNNVGFNISYQNIYNAIKNTKFIGRLQQLKDKPTVIIDGSHNISGAKALKQFILENKENREIIMIVGMKEGKQADEYFEQLAPLVSNLIVTEIQDNNIKSIKASKLLNIIGKYNKSVEIELSHEEAYSKAIKLCDNNDIIIITGSLYLISEFYKMLNKKSK